MTFETPAALWGLLSLALLALFSLWRQAAVPVTVPSLRLWELIPGRNPPIRALRRPKWRMDLLFQALAVAAAVAALAGPALDTSKPRPRKVAFVFDTSARLRAGDRLERLKAEARRLLDGDLRHDDVALFAAAPGPRRLERLDEVRVLDEHVDLDPLIAVARQEAAHVILFSDRPAGGVPAVLLAGPAGNLGIVDLTASDEEVFVRIANHGSAREVPIRLTSGGQAREFRETVPAGGRSWIRREDFSKADDVAVELLVDDPFALDNRAAAARLASPRAVVSLTGRPHPDLERAFRSIPGAILREGAGDALVSVGYDAAPGPAKLRVAVRTPAAAAGAVQLAGHPLTAGMKPEHLIGLGELPPEARGGEAVATAEGKPAIALRGAELNVAADLSVEGWRKTASFPIFWTNVIDWARQGAAGFTALRVGKPVALQGREFLPRAVGPAAVEGRPFEVSLLDERETDLEGRAAALDWKAGDPSGREPVRRPLGGFAAALALLFVVLAWMLGRRPD